MEENLFQDCYEHWVRSDGYSAFWPELARKWNFPNGENLRLAFKDERKKRGIKKENKRLIMKAPKILIFDIENSYIKTALWHINKNYVNKTQILEDWYILSWSAKWLYDDEVMSDVLTPKESIKKNDFRIVKSLWELLNEADFVISYNGNFHDIPKSNTRFLVHGLPPPAPYKSIDIYQTISRVFSFTNKSMDFVNCELGLDRKKENSGMELWTLAMAGNQEALKEMEEYNKVDVTILEEQYLRVRPWIKNHPHIGLYHDSTETMCGYCGSKDLIYTEKMSSTPSGLYKIFRCSCCDGIGRAKINELTKSKRKSLLVNS